MNEANNRAINKKAFLAEVKLKPALLQLEVVQQVVEPEAILFVPADTAVHVAAHEPT